MEVPVRVRRRSSVQRRHRWIHRRSRRPRVASFRPRRFTGRHFAVFDPVDQRYPVRLIDAKPRALHFVETHTRFRGSNVVLRVAQYRDHRDLQRIEEAHQRTEDHRVGFDAIGDYRHTVLVALDLCVQQQVGDAARDRLNVDVRRQHRNQDAIGVASEFDVLVLVDGGRRVDDDAIDLVRNPHRERPRHFGRNVERRRAVDARHVFGALRKPARARRLCIEIPYRRELAARRIEGREVRCNRGLAGTAFRVQHHDFKGHRRRTRMSYTRAGRYLTAAPTCNRRRSAMPTAPLAGRDAGRASRRTAFDGTKIVSCAACRPHIATHRER